MVVVASRDVSKHAPTVKLKALKGKSVAKPTKLKWSAHDADGGKLVSTLQYAADGKHFQTVAAGLNKRSFKVDPADLAGGDKARFRVVVTDGVLTGTALGVLTFAPATVSRRRAGRESHPSRPAPSVRSSGAASSSPA